MVGDPTPPLPSPTTYAPQLVKIHVPAHSPAVSRAHNPRGLIPFMDGGRPARRPTRCASSRGPNSIFFFSLWHYLAHPPPHAKAPHLHVSTGVHGHAPLSAIHLVPCHLAFQIRLIRHGVYNGSRLSSLHAAVSEFAVPSYCRSISDSAGRYIAFWQDLWRRPCQYPRCGSSINQATLCSVAPKRSAARLALYTRLPLSQSNHSTCHWLS